MGRVIKRKGKLLTALAILAAIGLLSIAIYVGRTIQYEDWVATSGLVQKVQRMRGWTYHIYYTYTVTEATYSGRANNGREPNITQGDIVEIWYDPDHPSQSSLGKPSPGLDPFAPFLLFPIAVEYFVQSLLNEGFPYHISPRRI